MDEQTPELPEGTKMLLRTDPEKEWEKVKRSIDAQKPRGRQVMMMKLAAAILLLIGVVDVIYLLLSGPETFILYNASSVSQVRVLPDSSVVYIHPGSEITYESTYSEERSITMKGQAFFDVKRDQQHPFTVSAGQSTVQVLGTSFNVNDDSSRLDVTVASGKVSVQTIGQALIVLEKGEKASYDKLAYAISKLVNDDMNYDSWKTGQLHFQHTPFAEVISTLEKYFDITIAFDKTRARNITYTSDFNDPTLQEVLAEMKDVLGVDYTESGKQITIVIP
jgi:transmembrane sensor